MSKTKKKRPTRSSNLLKIVHIDISEPLTSTLCGDKYFVTFIDDFSHYVYLYLIKEKSYVFEKYKNFKIEVEKQSGNVIKIVRSNRGVEYYGKHGTTG